MLSKSLVLKIFRNLLINRNHPFFAHFFVTERCNLKCKYCEVYKNPSAELDEDEAKRVIDILADMKIAVLSFTGGEPLLRKDIYALIEHAKKRDLYVKISSNGTMPLSSYQDLLGKGVDSINISMDGLSNESTLPYSKIDKKILKSIEFLYTKKQNEKLFVSTLYFNGNAELIKNMFKFFNDKFPGLEILIQPVVTGVNGAFRSKYYDNVDPSLLIEMEKFPNLANPPYFNRHCIEFLSSMDGFNWKCKAGRMFFDIRANGDFYLCQDIPTKLNILKKDFLQKWENLDVEQLKRKCNGCTYSCYILAQRSFEFKNALTWYHYSKRL